MGRMPSNEEKAESPRLQCQKVSPRGETPEALTVGDIFKIECPTESFVLNPSKLKFITAKPYALQILQTELQPDGRLQIMATSYQVGEFTSKELKLSDGVGTLAVDGLAFKVESVIDPKNPPQGPFGPFGGHTLNLPPMYLWSFLTMVGLVLVWVGLKFWRRWQRQRLIESLKKHDSRLGPQSQLHVRFRQLERQRFLEGGESSQYLQELEDILRLFIIRQFKIPAYDWSDRLILSDFQARFSFLGADMARELMILLRETRKARELKMTQAKDLEQLVRRVKRWADQVDRATGGRSRGRGVNP